MAVLISGSTNFYIPCAHLVSNLLLFGTTHLTVTAVTVNISTLSEFLKLLSFCICAVVGNSPQEVGHGHVAYVCGRTYTGGSVLTCSGSLYIQFDIIQK